MGDIDLSVTLQDGNDPFVKPRAGLLQYTRMIKEAENAVRGLQAQAGGTRLAGRGVGGMATGGGVGGGGAGYGGAMGTRGLTSLLHGHPLYMAIQMARGEMTAMGLSAGQTMLAIGGMAVAAYGVYRAVKFITDEMDSYEKMQDVAVGGMRDLSLNLKIGADQANRLNSEMVNTATSAKELQAVQQDNLKTFEKLDQGLSKLTHELGKGNEEAESMQRIFHQVGGNIWGGPVRAMETFVALAKEGNLRVQDIMKTGVTAKEAHELEIAARSQTRLPVGDMGADTARMMARERSGTQMEAVAATLARKYGAGLSEDRAGLIGKVMQDATEDFRKLGDNTNILGDAMIPMSVKMKAWVDKYLENDSSLSNALDKMQQDIRSGDFVRNMRGEKSYQRQMDENPRDLANENRLAPLKQAEDSFNGILSKMMGGPTIGLGQKAGEDIEFFQGRLNKLHEEGLLTNDSFNQLWEALSRVKAISDGLVPSIDSLAEALGVVIPKGTQGGSWGKNFAGSAIGLHDALWGDMNETRPHIGHVKNEHHTHIGSVNINQSFAEGFDPDRIAVAFKSQLMGIGSMKTTSQYSPTGGR